MSGCHRRAESFKHGHGSLIQKIPAKAEGATSNNVSTSPFFLPVIFFQHFWWSTPLFALCSSDQPTEATAAAQIMSSDGLGGHVCIVSSAAGLISLPGRRGKMGPEGQLFGMILST